MRSRACILYLIVTTLAFPLSGTGRAQMADPIKVVFLNIAQYDPVQEYWWSLCSDFMLAAAEDLGIELEILYAERNRKQMIRNAQDVISGPDKPDFIVMPNLKQSAGQIMKIARDHGVKVLLFNGGLSDDEKETIGGPRDVFPNWIGQILPDDRQAGYLQAKVLLDTARAMGLTNARGQVQMIATAGTMSDTPAIERDKGLMEQIASRKHDVTLVRGQAFPADWREDVALTVFQYAFREYPETTAVWNANDYQAMGVLKAAKDGFGKNPGKDILITGIDWNPENILRIKSGELLGSIGGHFVEGVWALILIHDYARGIDFAPEGLSFLTSMALLNADNVDYYAEYLEKRDPARIRQINYRTFSKVHNPALEKYCFDSMHIIKQLRNTSE
jgi:ABC-type sugar transport system substrate-binding protein